jgi:hypothetical protein
MDYEEYKAEVIDDATKLIAKKAYLPILFVGAGFSHEVR